MAENFKYKITDQIKKLPREVTLTMLEKMLKQQGITPSTFYRDRTIPEKSDMSITIDRIRIYAKFFDCTIEDLLPEQKEAKVVSIRSRMAKPKFKTGLS
jgi:hypothetical protein